MNTALLAIPYDPMATIIVVVYRSATKLTGVISAMGRYNCVPAIGSRLHRTYSEKLSKIMGWSRIRLLHVT